MAQTKRKRNRKHKGTQGGSIDRRRRGRPRSRQEAKAQARRTATTRRDRPPSWRSAFNRALLMSGILLVMFALVLGRPFASSLLLAVTMMVFYVPAGYYLEQFLYNRRRAKEYRARQAAKQAAAKR